ncbi:MAG: hypothetical protein K9J85_00705 [Desulfobacteraceae bacterium]|nr:hypothetical protein [Desulfobacteraceae bacterium]
MIKRTNFILGIFVLLLAALCLWGCAAEPEEAKLEVADTEFSIRLEHEYHYVIDAKGVIRNVGEVDVKNVEITGYCTSCREEILDGEWFVSSYEKMPHQKDIISNLPAGGQAEFEFEEVAFCAVNRKKQAPTELPEGLEISIESYEIAE